MPDLLTVSFPKCCIFVFVKNRTTLISGECGRKTETWLKRSESSKLSLLGSFCCFEVNKLQLNYWLHLVAFWFYLLATEALKTNTRRNNFHSSLTYLAGGFFLWNGLYLTFQIEKSTKLRFFPANHLFLLMDLAELRRKCSVLRLFCFFFLKNFVLEGSFLIAQLAWNCDNLLSVIEFSFLRSPTRAVNQVWAWLVWNATAPVTTSLNLNTVKLFFYRIH